MLKRLLGVSTFGATFTVSAALWASPNYPDVLQEVSGAPCVPSCLLCHSTNPGRETTAVSSGLPFPLSVVGNGLAGRGDDATARAAFIRMRDGVDTNMDGTVDTPPTDADMDGVTDFDELAAGVDPNPGDAELCEITYGCGARVAPVPPQRGYAMLGGGLIAVGLAFSALRARRNSSRKRQ